MKTYTITPVLLAALLFAFTGSQSLAQLSGTDDFNDNSRDISKWYVEAPHLTEVNGRLEFTSTGVGDEDGIWVWITNEGSPSLDWSATIDTHNTASPTVSGQFCAMGIFVINSGDGDDVFGIMIGADGDAGRGIGGGWDINGVDYFDSWIPLTPSSVALQITYDADTTKLSCAYNTGSGYTSVTNFDVSGWSMNSTDTFQVAIAGWTENSIAVSSGQVYADNFNAYTWFDVSNHLDSVVLSHVRDFGNPTESADDVYDFDFTADTDASITNVSFTTPADETLTAVSDGLYEGMQTWRHETISFSPLTSRFGNGDYTVTVTYSNGTQQSTLIPYPILAAITMQPTFTSPTPLYDSIFSSTNASSSNAMITLQWENIDPNANVVDFYRHHVGLDDWESLGFFTDLFSADGPLSTRSLGPISFSPGTWGVEFFNGNAAFGYNADGVFYVTVNDSLSEYVFEVLGPTQDEDVDGIPNWWEAQYFGGPTNSIASEDSDHDGHNNLQESITGMDPTDSNSVFRITNCIPVADDFIIEWPTVSGRVYRTLWTDNLTNSFQILETGIEYPRNSCTDTVHSGENKCFYEVEVQTK